MIDADIYVAIGIEGDYAVRALGLSAGIACTKGCRRLTEKEALGLVSGNWYKILEVKEPGIMEGYFLIHERYPLEIGSGVKAVSGGQGQVSVI